MPPMRPFAWAVCSTICWRSFVRRSCRDHGLKDGYGRSGIGLFGGHDLSSTQSPPSIATQFTTIIQVRSKQYSARSRRLRGNNFELRILSTLVLGVSAVKFPSSIWSPIYLNALLRTSLLRSILGLQRFELLERVERFEQFLMTMSPALTWQLAPGDRR